MVVFCPFQATILVNLATLAGHYICDFEQSESQFVTYLMNINEADGIATHYNLSF